MLRTLKFIVTHPLNQGRRLEAVGRFVKWQLGSRMVPGPVIFPWVNGARLIIARGETGATGNVYAGLHEYWEMAFVLHALRCDDIFMDVGANVGAYTVLVGAGVGAQVYAFEPIQRAYDRLLENIRLNRLENQVTAMPFAVGPEAGTVDMSVDFDTMNRVVEGAKEDQSRRVTVVRLDDVLSDTAPTGIKIDVEGYEMPVLSGAKQILRHKNLRFLIVELNGSGARYGFSDEQIRKYLFDHEFEPYAYDPIGRKLSAGTPTGANTLFVRDPEFVRDRVASAPAFVVHNTVI